jgi:rare lipoprotein A
MRSKKILRVLAGTMLCLLFSWEALTAQTSPPIRAAGGPEQTGIASYYNDAMQGKPLSSGEKYDKNALVGGSKTLPMGTMVKVTNLKNNKTVVVKIVDRLPQGSRTHIIELSRRAAQELDMVKEGEARVRLEVVK